MFDKTINNLFPADVEINVNRAPTDESVKLLNEFQDKALGNVLDKMAIGNNVLNVTSIDTMLDPLGFDRRLFVVFKLNGQTYKFSEKIPSEFEKQLMDRTEYTRKVVYTVAEQIAIHLLAALGPGKF